MIAIACYFLQIYFVFVYIIQVNCEQKQIKDFFNSKESKSQFISG